MLQNLTELLDQEKKAQHTGETVVTSPMSGKGIGSGSLRGIEAQQGGHFFCLPSG